MQDLQTIRAHVDFFKETGNLRKLATQASINILPKPTQPEIQQNILSNQIVADSPKKEAAAKGGIS